MRMIKTTVLVVGAGPAGAACAARLKQAGMDFILLDKHNFPRIKSCAGWVTPTVLRTIGFAPQTYPHSFTVFRKFLVSLRGVHFTLPTRQYAIRRVEFDHWLLQRASLQVEQHTVRQIHQTAEGYEIDGKFAAKYLVGAGGTYCPVYRSLFQQQSPRTRENMIVALEEEFLYPVSDNQCRLWFMENHLPGYAWLVPKTNGFLNAGIGGKMQQMKKTGIDIRAHWMAFTEKLEKMGLVRDHSWQPISHTYALRSKKMAIRNGNAFLAGDAAGLATLDMGEGIGPALISGMRAAESILTGVPYSLHGIPRYSLPSILWGWIGHTL